MTKRKEPNDAWLYSGAPDHIGLVVPAAPMAEGGHVVALTLPNGTIRLMATRDPARYVGQVLHQVDGFGGEIDGVRVSVSVRHYQYQAIKRWVARHLDEHRVGADSFNVPFAVLTRRVNEAFSATGGWMRN
jgi:hypothetical protein